MSDRLPYLATQAAAPYDGIETLPVAILLDNIRSAYNAGSFFRTADAAGIEKLYLCGITPTPSPIAIGAKQRPANNTIRKTALGAEESVPWEHNWDAVATAQSLASRQYQVAAIETTPHAIDLFDWQPRFPVCIVFGNEVDGVGPELAAICDTHIRIPMLGRKHSLNVATAGGVVLYELLRKYRRLKERATIHP